MDLGVDGFRVDSAPFIYEDSELRDEPKSNIDGATLQEHTYLKHIYTMDLIDTYKLFGEWRKFMDSYASKHNQNQKVNDIRHSVSFFLFKPFIVFYSIHVIKCFLSDLVDVDGGVQRS